MVGITQSAGRRAHGATAIFISYRRDDAAAHAGRIADRLKARFGTNAVFMDVAGSIKPGEPVSEAIGRAVSSCDALLAIIGRHWLTQTDAGGKRRAMIPTTSYTLRLHGRLPVMCA